MTLRVVQFPSIADQLDELLVLRIDHIPVAPARAKRTTPEPEYGVGSKRCSCGAPKSKNKIICSNHPKKPRLL